MKQREFIDVDTSTNATLPPRSKKPETDRADATAVPVNIPMSWVRWLCYSVGFVCLLIPFHLTVWQLICGGLILGQFASQLNALINKKP